MVRALLFLTCILIGLSLISSQLGHPFSFQKESTDSLYNKLTEEEKRSPQFAVSALSTAKGVQVSLFASEPLLANPTVIEIDEKGRVWVCEANNYRPAITGRAANPQGDRVLILEDTDGDGKADKSTVFYQDPELNAPIGLWVVGNRAIVSQSPYVWLLTDTDGDDKADQKEVIFSGIDGEQHDHGIHSFVMGPDGKFYFAVGNEGKQILGKNGEPLKDKYGAIIDFKKYKQGLLLRCDEDFTNLEVIGHNFRNNYEPAIDSYGNIFQSDNDDDGNRGVRINYILEHGNYGYTDELTGASWRVKRTNMEDSIPFRHWHLNDPGVVPNLLQTGAGSPTGLIYYEGDLLPEPFRNQMIHCDAGPNAVRAYPIQKEKAGFSASLVNLLYSTQDQWFRPSDIAVAPDGSVFVSDWYDPGVGGHQMGDTTRGRIYRVAPDVSRYQIAPPDVNSIEGALKALANPNPAIRYLASKTLRSQPDRSIQLLKKLFGSSTTDSRLRARAFWILSKLISEDDPLWEIASEDSDANIRITVLRAARQVNRNITGLWLKLAEDRDPQVRREVAISLHGQKSPYAANAWAQVAIRYPGGDRWYLEALGIGAENNWDNLFQTWLHMLKEDPTQSQAGRDIVWRARTPLSIPYLAKLAGDNQVPLQERLRYFRAFDFNPGGREKSEAIMTILKNNASGTSEINQVAISHLDPGYVKQQPEARKVLQKLLDKTYGTEDYIELVKRFEPTRENPRLLEMAISKPYDALSRSAASQLLKQNGGSLVQNVMNGSNLERKQALLTSMARVGNETSFQLFERTFLNEKNPESLRKTAIRAMAGTSKGEDQILEHLRKGSFTGDLQGVAIQSLSNAWRKAVRMEAASYLGMDQKSVQSHPPVKELITRVGNPTSGKAVFMQYCSICHQVNSEGSDFGPALTEIGDKLSREGQYLAIYYPSAGISFGYEGYIVKLKDGTETAGIVSSKTETDLILKLPGGSTQEYKMANVVSIQPLDESMMSPGLHEAMRTDELVDLVEYLMSLKKDQ